MIKRRYLPNFDYDEWRPVSLNFMDGDGAGDATGGGPGDSSSSDSEGGFADGGGWDAAAAADFGSFGYDAASAAADSFGTSDAGSTFGSSEAAAADFGSFGYDAASAAADSFGGFGDGFGAAAAAGMDAAFGGFDALGGPSTDGSGADAGFGFGYGDPGTLGWDNSFSSPSIDVGLNTAFSGFDALGGPMGWDLASPDNNPTYADYTTGYENAAGKGLDLGMTGFNALDNAFSNPSSLTSAPSNNYGLDLSQFSPISTAQAEEQSAPIDDPNSPVVGPDIDSRAANALDLNDVTVTAAAPANPGPGAPTGVTSASNPAAAQAPTGMPSYAQSVAAATMDPSNPAFTSTTNAFGQVAAGNPGAAAGMFGGGPASLGFGVSDVNPGSVGGYQGALTAKFADPTARTVTMVDYDLAKALGMTDPTPQSAPQADPQSQADPSSAPGTPGGSPGAPGGAPSGGSPGTSAPGAPSSSWAGGVAAPGAPDSAPGSSGAPGGTPGSNADGNPGQPSFGPDSNAQSAQGDPARGILDWMAAQAAEQAKGAKGTVLDAPGKPTFYGPGSGGIEGANATKGSVGPNGQVSPNTPGKPSTLWDVAAGKSDYVTIAAVNGRDSKGNRVGGDFYSQTVGQVLNIPSVTFMGPDGKEVTLTNVKGIVHDRGGGVVGKAAHFDIALGKAAPDKFLNVARVGDAPGQQANAASPPQASTGKAAALEKAAPPGPPPSVPAKAFSPPAPGTAKAGAPPGTVTQSQVGKIRSQMIDPALEKALSGAAKAAGVSIDVFSGGQPSSGTKGVDRTGSHRHDGGRAADLTLHDENGKQISRYDPRYLQFLEEAAARGAGGTGAGYMTDPNSAHVGITGKEAIVGKGLGPYEGNKSERAAVERGLARYYAGQSPLSENAIVAAPSPNTLPSLFGRGPLAVPGVPMPQSRPAGAPTANPAPPVNWNPQTMGANPGVMLSPGMPGFPALAPADRGGPIAAGKGPDVGKNAPFEGSRAAGKGNLALKSREGDSGKDARSAPESSKTGTTDPSKVGVPVESLGLPGNPNSMLPGPGQTTRGPDSNPGVLPTNPGRYVEPPSALESLLGPGIANIITALPGLFGPPNEDPGLLGRPGLNGDPGGLQDAVPGLPSLDPGGLDNAVPGLPSVDPGGLENAEPAAPGLGPNSIVGPDAPSPVELPTVTTEVEAPSVIEGPFQEGAPAAQGLMGQPDSEMGNERVLAQVAQSLGMEPQQLMELLITAQELARSLGVSEETALQIIMQSMQSSGRYAQKAAA